MCGCELVWYNLSSTPVVAVDLLRLEKQVVGTVDGTLYQKLHATVLCSSEAENFA